MPSGNRRRTRDAIDDLLFTEGFFDPDGAASGSWSPSARQNFRAAVKHFKKFIEFDIPRRGEAGKAIAKELYGTEDPSDYGYQNIDRTKVDIKLMNRFARWLFKHARHLNDASKRIEYKTADCVFSAIKNHIVKSTMYDQRQQLLTDEKLKPIRSGLEGLFNNRVMRENRSLSRSHTSAEDSDTIRINMLCLWCGDPLLAQMASYVEALFQLGGRSTEIAVMAFRRLSLYQPSEFADAGMGRDLIPCAKLWRIKTRVEQDLSIFNHKDCFLRCFVFLLAHSMVLCNNPTDALFPDFFAKTQKKKVESDDVAAAVEAEEAEEAVEAAENQAEIRAILDGEPLDEAEDGAVDACGLPRYYRNLLQRIQNAADELNDHRENEEADDNDEEIFSGTVEDNPKAVSMSDSEEAVFNDYSQARVSFNERLDGWLAGNFSSMCFRIKAGLGAHSEKRHTVETILGDAGLNFVWMTFRAGWVNKKLHSIFKYANENPRTDRQCARVISNWKSVDCRTMQYGGGRPPDLRALCGKAEKGKPEMFAKALFNTYTLVDGANNHEFQYLLTATILLRLRDFLGFLLIHPQRKFGMDNEQHFEKNRFLQLVLVAANRADIDHPIGTLIEWSEIIERDFYQRNYQFVSVADLRRTGQADDSTFRCDTRDLSGFMLANAREQGALKSEVLELRTSMNNLQAQFVHQVNVNRNMTRELQTTRSLLSRLERQNALMLQLLSRSHGNAIASTGAGAAVAQDITEVSPITESPNTGSPTKRAQKTEDVAEAQQKMARLIPFSLGKESVRTVFLFWHSQGYCHLIGGDKNVRANFRKAVEYINLFLPEHVPAKPAFGSPEETEWNRKLQELTDAAFQSIHDWIRITVIGNESKRVSDSVSQFCKLMYDFDQALLPAGPQGESLFQPRNNKFRSKDEIVAAKAKNVKKNLEQPRRPRKSSKKRKPSEPEAVTNVEQLQQQVDHRIRDGTSALGTGNPVHAQENSIVFRHLAPHESDKRSRLLEPEHPVDPDSELLRGHYRK